MSERYLSELTAKLRALYKKERNISTFRGLFLLTTLWAFLLILGFVFSLIFAATSWARVLFAIGLAGSTYVTAWFIVLPAIRKPSPTSLAKKAESGFPELEDRLISAIELAPYVRDPQGFSAQLVAAGIDEAY